MATVQPRTLQGFFDYLPEDMVIRSHVRDTWRDVFERFGYGQLETPALEYADILKGKYGEEEKLIYQFKDRGNREVALRYDQTVPLARVIAEHYSKLTFPFKRYEINRVWRADAARKGRKREFYQCDIDIVGTKSLMADVEIIAVLHEGFKALGLKDHVISINNRKIIDGFIATLKIPEEKQREVFRSIDKLDKIGKDGVLEELEKRGISKTAIPKIMNYLKIQESIGLKDNLYKKGTADQEYEQDFKKILKQMEFAEKGKEGVREIEEMLHYADVYGIDRKHFKIDPSLVRGLDYYTGSIFEIRVPSFGLTSLAGGGRYDGLIGMFAGKEIPAVGVGIGFEPICMALQELDLGPKDANTTQVLVTIFSEEYVKESYEMTRFLRKHEIRTELWLDKNTKLGKQFQYADRKSIPYAIVIGPEEKTSGMVVVKNMKTGEQQSIPSKDVLKALESIVIQKKR
ncbi:histidine--tRNA ligase [Candidatus Peregrinibacteria bacterium]|nr:histidine--tRNA ligase [Candidatus Peregrinibacteria bacterium]